MAVQPFRIAVPQNVIDDVRQRLERAHWIDDLGDDGWKFGISIAYMRELADYWAKDFD